MLAQLLHSAGAPVWRVEAALADLGLGAPDDAGFEAARAPAARPRALKPLRDLLAQQTISGLGAVFDMFALAASIVGGLLAAASLSALGGGQTPGMMAR